MAQGAVASLPMNGTTGLTKDELYEILECQKIVRFRDAILSGLHPRIKVPPHLVQKPVRQISPPKAATATRSDAPTTVPGIASTAPSAQSQDNNTSIYNDRTANGQGPGPTSGRSQFGGQPKPTKAAKSEINPILLEKSEDLIKAEIQLQRQRLERALREQVEQRKISAKAALQTSESLPDFDLSDVLAKVLTIVHPSTAAEADQSVGAHTSASDSFDENTFYSSQHDTPEHSSSSQEHRDSGEIQPLTIPPLSTQNIEPPLTSHHDESRDVVMGGVSLSNDVVPGLHELARKPISPPLHTAQSIHTPQSTMPAANDAADVVQKSTTGNLYNDVAMPSKGTGPRNNASQVIPRHAQKRRLSIEEQQPSVVRNFNLSPVAPQPARVSPLATARAPPLAQQAFALQESTAEYSPSRPLAVAISSPESSPKGSKTTEKRKKKKKNSRKSGGGNKSGAPATPDSPYIKTEPKSPSPFAVAPLPRPHKRQRQTLNQGGELNYDEPRYEAPREEPREKPREHVTGSRNRDHRQPPAYRPDDDRPYEPREPEHPRYRRVDRDGGREEPSYGRVVSRNTYRPPLSPEPYTRPYSPNDPRPVRPESRMIVERHPQEPPRYYREPQTIPRANVIDLDRERSRSPVLRERRSPVLMAPPPRVAPARIVIDEYGRQYYTTAAPLSRQPTAAPIRIEDDYVYERPPLRAVPRPAEIYEDGVIYRRASPQYIPQRRVVALPEKSTEAQYRQREYSTRPVAMAPPPVDDYVRVREPVERREMSHFGELPLPLPPPPREYTTRIASVRPEAIRYEVPREYVPIARSQSIRPEPIHREYAASVRPEMRRELVGAQPFREYSVRPGEQEVVRREYVVPPRDGYPARTLPRRIIEEEYLPRREPQDLYEDDGRQEVIYR